MYSGNLAIVAQINLSTGIYYVSNQLGVSLGGVTYDQLIESVGNAGFLGNWSARNQVSGTTMRVLNGEKVAGGGYLFDATKVVNNAIVDIRLCNVGTHTTFWECEDYMRGMIKDVSCGNGYWECDIDAAKPQDSILLPATVIEGDAYSDAPKNSRGKTIPMQYGGLASGANGIFAKGISTNNVVGSQNVTMDTEALTELVAVGAWESGTRRFFKAQETTGTASEYNTTSINNAVNFTVDSRTWLDGALDAGTSGDIDTITVADSTKIDFTTEETVSDAFISVNIIAVDSELMLMVQDPSITGSNEVVLERGYMGTTAASHADSTKIYKSSNFASVNSLRFFERFDAKTLTNHYWDDDYSSQPGVNFYNVYTDPVDMIGGAFQNVVDLDTTTKFTYTNGWTSDRDISTMENSIWLSMDAKFDRIDDTFDVSRFFAAVKADISWDMEIKNTGGVAGSVGILLLNSSNETNFDDNGWSGGSWDANNSMIIAGCRTKKSGFVTLPRWIDSMTMDSWSEIGTIYDKDFGSGTLYRKINFPFNLGEDYSFSSLNQLNQKWKFQINLSGDGRYDTGVFTTDDMYCDMREGVVSIYNLGFWVEFVKSFTETLVPCLLIGRKLSSNVSNALGNPSGMTVDTVAHSPVATIADILFRHLEYDNSLLDSTWATIASDYVNSGLVIADDTDLNFGASDDTTEITVDTSSGRSTTHIGNLGAQKAGDWIILTDSGGDEDYTTIEEIVAISPTQHIVKFTNPIINSYTVGSSGYIAVLNFPKCAMSYGIDDDRVEGMEMCQQIADHFNLMIARNIDGSLRLISRHKLLYRADYVASGLAVATVNTINVEDVLMAGTEKRMTVAQSGTDDLYNDVIVKYQRNNSTDEYDAVYQVPDTYECVSSGQTIIFNMYRYYGGNKRTLTIESPYIYNDLDAERLAKQKINRHSETRLLVSIVLDIEHYSNVNSLSDQYFVGDEIYLSGSHQSITYSASQRFVVEDVLVNALSGEITLNLRSFDPVDSFTSTAVSQIDYIQDTVDNTDPTWQDTVTNTDPNVQDI